MLSSKLTVCSAGRRCTGAASGPNRAEYLHRDLAPPHRQPTPGYTHPRHLPSIGALPSPLPHCPPAAVPLSPHRLSPARVPAAALEFGLLAPQFRPPPAGRSNPGPGLWRPCRGGLRNARSWPKPRE